MREQKSIHKNTKQFKKQIGFVDQIDLAYQKGTIRKSHQSINENLSIINYYPLSHKDQSLPTFERSYRRKCFINAKQQTTLSLYVLVQPEMDKHLLRIRDNTCLRQGVFSGIWDSKIG